MTSPRTGATATSKDGLDLSRAYFFRVLNYVDTRKGYVALATHGYVALILRMNGSDRI